MSENEEHNPDRESDEAGTCPDELSPDELSPDVVSDDTVIMGKEDGAYSKPKPELSAPADPGELGPGLDPHSIQRTTEEVPQEFRDSVEADVFASVGDAGGLETKGMTEAVSAEGSAGESAGDLKEASAVPTANDDPDEILVLLDDESETGLVETDGLEGAGRLTGELGLSTESIEAIGLKSVNPLQEETVADVDAPDIDELEENGEPVGVIHQITELATSLDPDILGAGEGDDDGGYYEDDEQEYQGLEEEGALRSRARTFVVLGSLAAVAASGCFMFPEIKDWYKANFNGAETPATAGAVSIVSVPDEPRVGDGTEDGAEPQSEEPEVSRTQIVVRDRLRFAVKLGLQWEEREE